MGSLWFQTERPFLPAVAATTATTTGALALGLVYSQLATVKVLTIESFFGLSGLVLGCHLDEAKASGAAGVTVGNDIRGDHFAVSREVLSNIVILCLKVKIADIQFCTHGYLLLRGAD